MRSHPAHSLPSVLLLLALLPASGCGPGGTTESGGDVKVDLTLRPEPPKVGTATAVVARRTRTAGRSGGRR